MKRSILFGALAMFAVSALSIQNVNAQDEKVGTQTTQSVSKPDQDKPKIQNNEKVKPATPTNPSQSINDPKDKPTVDNEEHSPIKGGDDPKSVDPKKDGQEPAPVRTSQADPGQKNTTVEKQSKKPEVWEKTNKKSRPKKVKNQKTKKDSNATEVNKDDNAEGKDNKQPGMVKPGKNDKIHQKDSNSQEANKNEKAEGKDNKQPGMVKPGKNDKMQNNSQSSENTNNKNSEGYSNDTKKNVVKPTLQKDEPKELPNSVARPKQKVKQGTQTQNKTNAD